MKEYVKYGYHFKHGQPFVAIIEGTTCEGKVAIEDKIYGKIYLCQNFKDGYSCKDKLGYKFSWVVSDSKSTFEDQVSDLKLLSMAKFKPGDIVKIIKCGSGVADKDRDRVVTIVKQGVDYATREPGYIVDPPLGNNIDGTYNGVIGESTFKLYEEPPEYKVGDVVTCIKPKGSNELLSKTGLGWKEGFVFEIDKTNESTVLFPKGRNGVYSNYVRKATLGEQQTYYLQEARKRYPIGTFFTPAHVQNGISKITNDQFRISINGNTVYIIALTRKGNTWRQPEDDAEEGDNNYNRVLYEKNKKKSEWATIVKKDEEKEIDILELEEKKENDEISLEDSGRPLKDVVLLPESELLHYRRYHSGIVDPLKSLEITKTKTYIPQFRKIKVY